VKIAVGEEETTTAYDGAGDGDVVFVCAHGAGGSMADRGILATATALRDHGIGVVRFNFLYREKKSSRPDPMPKLMATIKAVVEYVRSEIKPKRVIIGGRSMGGRAASMLAAEDVNASVYTPADGLLLLAYPLHPPGQPEKLRDAHLPRVTMPVLCVNGTRDAFCTRELMERVLQNVGANWQMHWIDGADHSFHVPKSSGRTDADVLNEIAATTAAWLKKL
jgi:predicted alpha/beta-hydrolase family hydrolase